MTNVDEWIIMRNSNREPAAVVRAVKLGPRDDRYFRVVTWASTSEGRTLLGYFPTLGEADCSVRFDNTLPTRGAPNGTVPSPASEVGTDLQS